MQTRTDAELIKAYTERDDQGAFAELVSRHSAMVYRVCFRKLLNRHDAEDASQAVFMALVKKSKQVNWESSMARWLYTVARQTALFMARTRVRRVQKESTCLEMMDVKSHLQVTAQDRETVLEFLDDELVSLSAGQHEAVILRYLDGLSEKDAALSVGCAPHTLSCRASDGIANLRKRLVKRGCVLGVPALIGVLSTESQAAVPETLIPSLLAVPKLAATGAAAGTASANIIFLMEGALKTMAIAKIKTAGIGILIALLIGTTGVMAVKEIQKKQAQGVSEKPEIVASPSKQEVLDQSKSSKLETMDKTQSAKITQPPKARNFQAEMEEALKIEGHVKLKLVMSEWFDYDKNALLQWIENLSEENKPQSKSRSAFSDRCEGMRLLAEVWAEKDIVAASEWVIQIQKQELRSQALLAVIGKFVEKDPVAAKEWAMRIPDKRERENAFVNVALGWANIDPAAAAEWAEQLPEGEGGFCRSQALEGVAKNWARKDQIAAAEWALKSANGEGWDKVLIEVALTWAEKDPVAAAEWAVLLPEGKNRNETLAKIASTWAFKDHTAAAQWAEQLPNGEGRNNALATVASKWAETDPDKAAEWAAKLPEGKGRDLALVNVIHGLARIDPLAGYELAMKLPEGKTRDDAFENVASGWAQKDPTTAAQWALQLPEGEGKNKILIEIVGIWGSGYPVAAKTWVKGLQISEEFKNNLLKTIEHAETRRR